MDELNYKELHESFTSNNNGTTAVETVMVVLPSLLGGFLFTLIRSLPLGFCIGDGFGTFVLEFLFIIIPAILSFTILADFLPIMILTISIFCVGAFMAITILNHKQPSTVVNIFRGKCSKAVSLRKFTIKRRPCITYFRSYTNILTVLCILAVDFNIFPRRFCKTETFGYGMMDTGVGLYIVSNAVVSAESCSDVLNISLFSTVLSTLPLFLLGSGRLLATYWVGYQEHVTEYGKHWNFFFTLAATKILSTCVLKFFKASTKTYILFSCTLILSYELVLCLGLRDWIFSDAPRLNIFSANREGFSSIFGFTVLYICGVVLGKMLSPKAVLTVRVNVSLLKSISCWALILWTLTIMVENTTGVSRRLANMGYILWILSFSTTFFSLTVFFETISLIQSSVLSINSKQIITRTPILSEAINCHGLLFFLLGNILTGFVNLSVKTFLVGSVNAIVIVATYMLLNCGIVTILYNRKNAAKFIKSKLKRWLSCM